METALTCVTCGGPLPIAAAGERFTSCPYCHATLHFDGDAPAKHPHAQGAPPTQETAKDPRLLFNATLQDRLSAGDTPYGALRTAARAHSPDAAEGEAIARATLAIAYDFDKENHSHTRTDVTALQRIAAAFIKARIDLASAEDTEINLPFLCATADGPKHCQRALKSIDIEELSQRPPSMFDPPASTPPIVVAEPEPPKRKKWWPFGAP